MYRQKEIKSGNMLVRDERAGVGDILHRVRGHSEKVTSELRPKR